MTARARAALGRADGNHKAIKAAIEALGFPVMDLSAAGGGVEDLLVGLHRSEVRWHAWGERYVLRVHFWIVVECKVPKNRRGEIMPSQFKPAQKEWHARSKEWPRLIPTSAEDAVRQIRALTDVRTA